MVEYNVVQPPGSTLLSGYKPREAQKTGTHQRKHNSQVQLNNLWYFGRIFQSNFPEAKASFANP